MSDPINDALRKKAREVKALETEYRAHRLATHPWLSNATRLALEMADLILAAKADEMRRRR